MASFNSIITNEGIKLLSGAVNSTTKLVIDSVSAGDGSLTTQEPAEMTALISPVAPLNIIIADSGYDAAKGEMRIIIHIMNDLLTSTAAFREIGLFSGGTLFCYAWLSGPDTDNILAPPAGTAPDSSLEFRVFLIMTNDEYASVSVTYSISLSESQSITDLVTRVGTNADAGNISGPTVFAIIKFIANWLHDKVTDARMALIDAIAALLGTPGDAPNLNGSTLFSITKAISTQVSDPSAPILKNIDEIKGTMARRGVTSRVEIVIPSGSGYYEVLNFTGSIRILSIFHTRGSGEPTDFPTIKIDNLQITPQWASSANLSNAGSYGATGMLRLYVANGVFYYLGEVVANSSIYSTVMVSLMQYENVVFEVNQAFRIWYNNNKLSHTGTRNVVILYENLGSGSLYASKSIQDSPKYFKSTDNISFNDVVKYGITLVYYHDGYCYVTMPDQEIQESWSPITEMEFLEFAPVDPVIE